MRTSVPGRTARDSAVSPTASQRVAEHLRQSILRGALAPGTRIMQEEIAASLQASRLPVREALRILEAEGLVVLKANSGAWVSKLDMAECEGVYKMRERLEPLALVESIPNLTGADVVKLEEIQNEIERTTDADVFLGLDRELHLATYVGCPIEQLTTTVQRFWNTTQHYRRAFARIIDDAGWKIIYCEHHLIINAIKRADTADAERYLAGHIRRTRKTLATHPELFPPHPS